MSKREWQLVPGKTHLFCVCARLEVAIGQHHDLVVFHGLTKQFGADAGLALGAGAPPNDRIVVRETRGTNRPG